MALITCPECGVQISDKAERCPKCGLPLKQKSDNNINQVVGRKKGKWKLTIIILLVITVAATIIFSLVMLSGTKQASDNCNIINDHEYVDLGLPSGTMWATCNVGATAPIEYGDYFAWGETAPKNVYNSDNYNFSESPNVLSSNYDVATTCWGEGWRMPTFEEFDELTNSCNWEWTDIDGVNGYKVTGTNGNSIFLPAAGRGNNGNYNPYTKNSDKSGEYGYYWSSTLCSDYNIYAKTYDEACALEFYSGFYIIHNKMSQCERYNG